MRAGDLPYDSGSLAAVPKGQGARTWVFLAVAWTLLSCLAIPVVAWTDVTIGLLSGTDLVREETGTVVTKTFTEGSGDVCDKYRFEIATPEDNRPYEICVNSAGSDLEEGDRLQVSSVSWVDGVLPTSRVGAKRLEGLFWTVLGTLLIGSGIQTARRYSRLGRGGDELPHLVAVVESVSPRRVCLIAHGSRGLMRIKLLPALQRHGLVERQRVDLWPSRLTRRRRRPVGPWVIPVRRGSARLFTHGWVSQDEVESPLADMLTPPVEQGREWRPSPTRLRIPSTWDTYQPDRSPGLRARFNEWRLARRRRSGPG